MRRKNLKKIMAATLSLAMITGCGSTASTTATSEAAEEAASVATEAAAEEATEAATEEAAVEDGYIAGPYAVSSEEELMAEVMTPVFYENEDGPTIGVTQLGVIVQDGKYFRDLDNDQELDDFEDWRLDADTRAAAYAAALTDTQLTHQVANVGAYSPVSTAKADVVDENGNPQWDKLFPATGMFGSDTQGDEENNVQWLNYAHSRTIVMRSNPEVEVGVWFNNGLEQYSEYDAIQNGEVTVPFFTYVNPQAHGLTNSEGVAAAALGEGSVDIVLEDAQMDRQVMYAKGVDGLYGPQVDLATDPRWSRNSTTYGEREDLSADIAAALVEGYQNGTDGLVQDSLLVTIKHFPGDGAAYNGFESHGQTGRYRIYSTENSLADYQLKPFIAAFEAGAAGVMPGYSQPIVDERIAEQSITYNGETYDIRFGGRGNAFNEDILQTLLREILGFDGLINSDSLSANAQQGVEDLSNYERMVQFIKAGNACGVIMFDSGVTVAQMTAGVDTEESVMPAALLDEALANGDVTREELEAAAASRIKVQMQTGNLENPYRDLEESVATVEELTPQVQALAEKENLDSIVLMKNTDSALPLSDTSVSIYVQAFNQTDDADPSAFIEALEAAGYTVVDDYNEADVAYLQVNPSVVGTGESKLAILDLAEDVETPVYDNNAKRTDETALVTTVVGMDEFQEIAEAVHANGGKVIGEINASNAWILTNMEPYCDALVGTFANSNDSIVQVVSGAHSPVGKLPMTMVADDSVIALVETDLNGEVWDVCVSPNDVPGYVKDEYMDEDVLAASPSGSYAYQDADGNLYVSGFGLTY